MKNKSFMNRLGFALSGIAAGLRGEKSFRLQALGLCFVLAVLLFTRPAPVWWALLLLAAGFVLTAELLNSALERLLDHLHPEEHAIIKTVKDMLAGAVLVMCLTALAVFAAFLWSYA
ncbi:MAG: diacylglycerol kinase [Alphaproteobacteria bacterium]|nr:diacylglycerol kinase [Alphaproteobacteria bacterium]